MSFKKKPTKAADHIFFKISFLENLQDEDLSQSSRYN